MSNVLPHNEARAATDLAGKYRLIAELGQGGMASVYLAVAMGNSGFRKLAVVKILRPEIAVDDEFVQMFLDEAKLCARLSHPNIVHTYDVGVDDVGHLMAMEYLDGVSLHAAIAKLARGAATFTFAMQAKVLLEVLEGLRYAHGLKDYDGRSLEIVHRDVTPHNIFVTYEGQVKLLDFGIAKAATSSVRTATGVIKGKLTYMAPEQARGENVDARADLYAVGVMLWEAVTGRRRWPTGLSQPALFTRLAAGEPPESPNGAALGYPPEIDVVVLKAMATKPEDRYQTATEFRDALEAVVRGLPPVSLRDLGTMLAAAFADGRERLRNVIEEQFRAIDSGGHPSAPHRLPAVAPPGANTASEILDGGRPADAGSEESRSRRLTVSALRRSLPPWWQGRSRLVLVTAAMLMMAAAGIAFGGYRARSGAAMAEHPSAHGAAHEAHDESAAVPSVSLPLSDLTKDARAHTETQASSSSEAAEHAESVRRFNRPPPGRSPGPPPHPGGAESTAASQPTAQPAPGPESLPAEPTMHRADGKPKVQLERDNPWP